MTDNDGARVCTSSQYIAGRPWRVFPVSPQPDVDGCAPVLILNLHEVITISGAGRASAGSEKLGRENHSGNPCGETTLTQSSVSVTRDLDLLTHTWRAHRHTYARRVEKPGQTLQYLLCCYDIALKELIECIKGIFFSNIKEEGGKKRTRCLLGRLGGC